MSNDHDMISPFEEKQVRGSSISYGLSSLGMMLEYQMNLKYLLMLIPKLLIQKFQTY